MRQAQGDHVGFAPPLVDLLSGGAFSKGGQSKAEAVAQKKLERTLERAVDLVACPKCKKFQAHMIRAKRFKLFKIAGLLALLTPWPLLMLTIKLVPRSRPSSEFKLFLGTAVGLAISVVVITATVLAFRFCPGKGRFFPFSKKDINKGELEEGSVS
jgi:hypothetical protein